MAFLYCLSSLKMSREASIPAETKLEKTHELPLGHRGGNETKRHDRNESERKRRNRFNGLIDELGVCIADRCKTKRCTEKSSILRLTMEYFSEQQVLAAEKAAKESCGSVKPAFVTEDEFNYVFLETSCTFVFAVDVFGNFIYISENIHNVVGHLPSQVLQRNVFDFINAQHHFIFQGLLSILKSDPRGCLAQRFQRFSCQFRRGSLFSCPHRCGCCDQCSGSETLSCTVTILRNLPQEKFPNLSVSDCILVLAKPLNRAPLNTTLLRADGRQTKFTATLSGAKYAYLDKRVASVLGFFPSELIGNSFFEYCHHEDLVDLAEYHEILLLTGRITTCCYRHLTKGQSWIWLRSRYHLCYSDWSSKPQAVTCLSWVLSYEEVCATQGEILARDRQKFAQIRAEHESIDGKSACSDNSNCPVASSPGCISEACDFKMGKAARVSTAIVSDFKHTTSKTSLDRTPGSQDSQADICTSHIPYSDEFMDNELTEFEGFLQRLHLPVNLTAAQRALHDFLSRFYMKLVSAVNKQEKELGIIKKQIKIQGELRDLVEQLEEARAKNDIEEEYSTTRTILNKYEEMRRVCIGSNAEKPAAESYDIYLRRLQETGAEKCSQGRQTSALLESDQVLSSIEEELYYSPIQVDQSSCLQRQHDVFFNQEQWLPTPQAQQAQLEQQFLVQQLSNTQYLPHGQMMTTPYQQQQQFPHFSRGFQQAQNNQIDQQILSQVLFPQPSFFGSSNEQAFGMAFPQESLTVANGAFSTPLSEILSIFPLSPPQNDYR